MVKLIILCFFTGLGKGRKFNQTKGGSRRASTNRRGRHAQLLAEVDSTSDLLELVLEHLLNLDA